MELICLPLYSCTAIVIVIIIIIFITNYLTLQLVPLQLVPAMSCMFVYISLAWPSAPDIITVQILTTVVFCRMPLKIHKNLRSIYFSFQDICHATSSQ